MKEHGAAELASIGRAAGAMICAESGMCDVSHSQDRPQEVQTAWIHRKTDKFRKALNSRPALVHEGSGKRHLGGVVPPGPGLGLRITAKVEALTQAGDSRDHQAHIKIATETDTVLREIVNGTTSLGSQMLGGQPHRRSNRNKPFRRSVA